MADVQEVIVKFIGDTTQLKPAVDQLQDIGDVSSESAQEYKNFAASATKASSDITTNTSKAVKSLSDMHGSLSNIIKAGYEKTIKKISESFGVMAPVVEHATKATLAFNAASEANPLVGLAALTLAVVAALQVYAAATDENTDAEKRRAASIEATAEAQKKAADILSQSQGTLETELAILKSSATSYDQKSEAIANIRKQYPEYLGAITAENVGTVSVNVAIEKQINLLRTKAAQQAAGDVYNDKLKDMLNAQNDLNNTLANGTTTWERFTTSIKDFRYWFKPISPEQEVVAAKMKAVSDATIAADESFKNFNGTLEMTGKTGPEAIQAIIDKYRLFKSEVVDFNFQPTFNAKEFDDQKKVALASAQYRIDLATKGSAEEYNARKAQIDAEHAYVINDINTTATAKSVADYKYYGDLHKLRVQAALDGQKIADANSKAMFEITERQLKLEADLYAQFVNDDKNPYALRLAFLQNYTDAALALLDKQKQAELSKATTGAEVANIEDKYLKLSDKLLQDAFIKRNKLSAGYNADLLKQTEQFWKNMADASAAAAGKMIADVDGIYSALAAKNDAELTDRLGKLDAEYKAGTIKFEDYLKQRQAALDEFNKSSASNEVSRLQAELGNLQFLINNKTISQEDYTAQSTKIQADLNVALKALYGEDFKDFEAANKEKLKAATDAPKFEAEQFRSALAIIGEGLSATLGESGSKMSDAFLGLFDTLKKIGADDSLTPLQKKLETITAITAAAQQAINALFTKAAENRQQQVDNEIADIEERKNTEIEAAGLTQSQVSQINARYAKQEADIKNKAAKQQRAADLKQAVINGLLAVGNALATVKPFVPAALIAAGLAATLAGYQTAAIASAPLPRFAKGTKKAPKGYAWVGEQGPELTYLKGGEKIYTSHESRRIEKGWKENGYSMHADSMLLNAKHTSTSVPQFDYDAMGRSVGQHAGAKLILNADENGFTTFITRNQNRMKIREKRYKWG